MKRRLWTEWWGMETHWRFCPAVKSTAGVTAKDNRLFLNAVIWIARSGAPWRDFATVVATGTAHGDILGAGPKKSYWEKVLKRWTGAGSGRDHDWLHCRTRSPACSWSGKKNCGPDGEGLGRSRGGLTSKIHAVVDARESRRLFLRVDGSRCDPSQGFVIGQTSWICAGGQRLWLRWSLLKSCQTRVYGCDSAEEQSFGEKRSLTDICTRIGTWSRDFKTDQTF